MQVIILSTEAVYLNSNFFAWERIDKLFENFQDPTLFKLGKGAFYVFICSLSMQGDH